MTLKCILVEKGNILYPTLKINIRSFFNAEKPDNIIDRGSISYFQILFKY